MVYSLSDTARWNDTDARLCVRPSMILTYMQECACRHMRDAGQDLDLMRERDGLAFILTRLSLRFFCPLRPLEAFTAQTWISPESGIQYPRWFRVLRADGTLVAEAASQWILLDLATRLPVRAGKFQYSTTPEEPLSFAPPRRFTQPDSLLPVGERVIRYSDTDYNGHMNNTRYPDMLCDYLPDGTVPHVRVMHLNFVREAPAGDTVRILRGERATEDGRAFLFHTQNAAGELCLEAEVLTDLSEEREEGEICR